VKGNNSIGNDDNVNKGNNNFVILGPSRNYRPNNSGQGTGYIGAQTGAV
jgi:hypothetical protein